MKWKKLGKIIKADCSLGWNQSHAMLPIPRHLHDNVFQIYYCGRDISNKSHIGAVTIDLSDPEKIIDITREPLFSPGELGCFDDNGVSPSSIVVLENKIFLYYIGWKPRCTTRMSVVGGLAESTDDGKSFRRVSRAPVLRRTDKEPYNIMTAPFVIKDGSLFKMWYVSGTGWIHSDLPMYNIKYAESDDGISWRQNAEVAIEARDEHETSLARPCVLKGSGIYRMWYSYKYKNNPYVIGYAESENGKDWLRKDDEVGINPSESGWDSEMIEYAHVFTHRERMYMLYNGNGYGTSGVGLAVLEQ